MSPPVYATALCHSHQSAVISAGCSNSTEKTNATPTLGSADIRTWLVSVPILRAGTTWPSTCRCDAWPMADRDERKLPSKFSIT